MKKKKIVLVYNSPVMLTFVLLCFIATLLGILTEGAITRSLFSVYRTSFADPLTYLRFFTHVLGHGGIEHFINNAMFLLLLGPLLEEKYGSSNILKVILITALITGLMHFFLRPGSALCGASGVVFAYIMLASLTAFRSGEIPISFILIALLYIGKEVYSGIAVSDNISNLTHIIGGIVGSLCGFALNRRRH